ncbi:MAG: trigger factor [Lachnospiraceae bacterium]|nr:trigger factor [Lachnospiraceae bacterium]
MSVQVENLEKSTVKLTIEVAREEFEGAIKTVYGKAKNRINIPGFRKGKAPLSMVEKYYGKSVFYEDAANEIIPKAYEDAVTENNIEVVSQPKIELVQLNDEGPFIFSATVGVKPEVKLGEYMGVTVSKPDVEVSDDELNEELEKTREKNSRSVSVDDRPVQDKDEVTIDFEGFVDGEAFEGGKGEDYKLEIGSHSFIDTFEEQLIGHSIDEEVEVNVTFPEEYHEASLAGKPALFKVKIKAISFKELPELDDDFAQDLSDFDTLDEYKEDVRNKLKEAKVSAADRAKEEEVINKIIENSELEVSDMQIESVVDQMKREFAQRIQAQGISYEQYLMFTGMTEAQVVADIRPQALMRIQSRLVLEKIVEAENIEVSEEEIDKEIETIANMYQMEADRLKEVMGEEEKKGIETDAKVQKAVKIVVEAAKEEE